MSPYDVLGIPRGSSAALIQSAYRRLALQHHPDRGGDPEKFRQVKEAYEKIKDAPQIPERVVTHDQRVLIPERMTALDVQQEILRTKRHLNQLETKLKDIEIRARLKNWSPHDPRVEGQQRPILEALHQAKDQLGFLEAMAM